MKCDEQIDRAVVDRVGRCQLQQLAVAHHADAVAERHRLRLVVRHIERGDAAFLDDAAQIVAQPQAQLGIEIAQGLVEQQQQRLINGLRASATRCIWPPESAVTGRCA